VNLRAVPGVVARETRRILSQGRRVLMRLKLSSEWRQSESGLHSRSYEDYETYREHQRLKLDAHRVKSIRRHDARFFAALRERLPEQHASFAGARVLCLAARQGTEVRAFLDHGAFAVGIDLNPGRDNRYVMVGDFHQLQFADGTVDVVYTNSLDHAFDLERILSEVRRVLTASGLLICEVGLGTDSATPGFYESLAWKNVDELAEHIRTRGFDLVARANFEVPWTGQQLVLRRNSAAAASSARESSVVHSAG
jgi:SAM-dependent methyltransferase